MNRTFCSLRPSTIISLNFAYKDKCFFPSSTSSSPSLSTVDSTICDSLIGSSDSKAARIGIPIHTRRRTQCRWILSFGSNPPAPHTELCWSNLIVGLVVPAANAGNAFAYSHPFLSEIFFDITTFHLTLTPSMTVAGDSANGTPAKVTQLASISGFKFLFEKLMNRFSKSFFAS